MGVFKRRKGAGSVRIWGVWERGGSLSGEPPMWVAPTREEAEAWARRAAFAACQGHWRAWLSLRGLEPSPETWAGYAEAAGEGGPAMEAAAIDVPAGALCELLREAGGMEGPEVWEEGWEKAGGERRDPRYR